MIEISLVLGLLCAVTVFASDTAARLSAAETHEFEAEATTVVEEATTAVEEAPVETDALQQVDDREKSDARAKGDSPENGALRRGSSVPWNLALGGA
mmetsp:Transcript_75709/g.245313  ORF Transcript_75709/g.245313 Transcript_75709/m.245313 type:complete len:97 (+) Transcript_75709:164-454(+)